MAAVANLLIDQGTSFSSDVTVKDATGSNQYDLSTAGNMTHDTVFDTLFVVYRSTGTSRVWIEISRSSNV